VLHERFLAIGPGLADRRLEIDVRRRRAHPDLDRAGADDGGVAAQRARQVGDRAARRIPGPVVIRGRGPEAAGPRPGVAVEVGQRTGPSIPGERVLPRLAGRLIAKRAVLGQVPGPRGGLRNREARPRVLEAGRRLTWLGAAGA